MICTSNKYFNCGGTQVTSAVICMSNKYFIPDSTQVTSRSTFESICTCTCKILPNVCVDSHIITSILI